MCTERSVRERNQPKLKVSIARDFPNSLLCRKWKDTGNVERDLPLGVKHACLLWLPGGEQEGCVGRTGGRSI